MGGMREHVQHPDPGQAVAVGVDQFAGVARQVAASNVTINNLLPGTFDTDRIRVTLKGMAVEMFHTLNNRSFIAMALLAGSAAKAVARRSPMEL